MFHSKVTDDAAAFIFSQRGIDETGIGCDMAVDEGQVCFLDAAGFPEAAKRAGRGVGLGDDGHAAGFAVEAIDQVRVRSFAQVQPDAADQAGHGVGLGGMTDQAGRFVDGQQIGIFVNDIEQVRAQVYAGKVGKAPRARGRVGFAGNRRKHERREKFHRRADDPMSAACETGMRRASGQGNLREEVGMAWAIV